MITIEQMVQREVLCCMSSLVSTLAQAGGCTVSGTRERKDNAALALSNICDQAVELAAPVLDYEEAATQAGWIKHIGGFHIPGQPEFEDGASESWQELCEAHYIDSYEREVFEHWAVSQWLADKLAEQGEHVDTDFGALCIWARTTTGQAISMDGCIQRIYKAIIDANRFELEQLDRLHSPHGWECVPMPTWDDAP